MNDNQRLDDPQGYVNADNLSTIDGGGEVDNASLQSTVLSILQSHSEEQSMADETAATMEDDDDATTEAATAIMEMEEVKQFNGHKGEDQKRSVKDVTHAIAFGVHLSVTVWWFVDSFLPVSLYIYIIVVVVL